MKCLEYSYEEFPINLLFDARYNLVSFVKVAQRYYRRFDQSLYRNGRDLYENMVNDVERSERNLE